MFLNIQIDLIILETCDYEFTLTTKKSLHIIFKPVCIVCSWDEMSHYDLPAMLNYVLRVYCVAVCSWDEMSHYDLPAMLNYVLRVTGRQQVYYIGHSQGTLIAFAQLSHDRVLANKVCYETDVTTLLSGCLAAVLFLV